MPQSWSVPVKGFLGVLGAVDSQGQYLVFPGPSFSQSMDDGEMALAECPCLPPFLSLPLFLGPVVGSAVFKWDWGLEQF